MPPLSSVSHPYLQSPSYSITKETPRAFSIACVSLKYIALTFITVGTGYIASHGLLASAAVLVISYTVSTLLSSQGLKAFQTSGPFIESAKKVQTYMNCNFWNVLLMAGVLTGITGALGFCGISGLLYGTRLVLPLMLTAISACLIPRNVEEIILIKKLANSADPSSQTFMRLHESLSLATTPLSEEAIKDLLDIYKDVAYGKELDFHKIENFHTRNSADFALSFPHLLPILTKTHLFDLVKEYPLLQTAAVLNECKRVRLDFFGGLTARLGQKISQERVPVFITYLGHEAYGGLLHPPVSALISHFATSPPRVAKAYFQSLFSIATDEEVKELIAHYEICQGWDFLNTALSKPQLDTYICKKRVAKIAEHTRSIKGRASSPEEETQALDHLEELWSISDRLEGITERHHADLFSHLQEVLTQTSELEFILEEKSKPYLREDDRMHREIPPHWRRLDKNGHNFLQALSARREKKKPQHLNAPGEYTPENSNPRAEGMFLHLIDSQSSSLFNTPVRGSVLNSLQEAGSASPGEAQRNLFGSPERAPKQSEAYRNDPSG